jgi:hypothetical protein
MQRLASPPTGTPVLVLREAWVHQGPLWRTIDLTTDYPLLPRSLRLAVGSVSFKLHGQFKALWQCLLLLAAEDVIVVAPYSRAWKVVVYNYMIYKVYM